MQAQENTRQEQHTLWPRNVAVARVAGKAVGAVFKQAAKNVGRIGKPVIEGLGEEAVKQTVKQGRQSVNGNGIKTIANSAVMESLKKKCFTKKVDKERKN
jgi:hypothetical protein